MQVLLTAGVIQFYLLFPLFVDLICFKVEKFFTKIVTTVLNIL